MMSIVACHISNHYHNAIASQVFNVGVPLFFIISGTIYANRSINMPRQWLMDRYFRLYMPLLAWIIYYTLHSLCINNGHISGDSWFCIILLLLNLQGLHHLFPNFKSIDGPWFFTIIMLCYITLIKYKKIEITNPNINNWRTILVMFIIVALASINNILDLTGLFYFYNGYIVEKYTSGGG